MNKYSICTYSMHSLYCLRGTTRKLVKTVVQSFAILEPRTLAKIRSMILYVKLHRVAKKKHTKKTIKYILDT